MSSWSWGSWFTRKRDGRRGLDGKQMTHRTMPASTTHRGSPAAASHPPPPPPAEFRAFGVTLTELHKRDKSALPIVLKTSYEWLNKNATKKEGLWRIPGNVKIVKQYKHQWDYGKFSSYSPDASPFDVCSLIKMFFKELPSPLIPTTLRRKLIDAAYLENSDARLEAMRECLKMLPKENAECLKYVIYHFHLVHSNKASTRMTAKSLAMCFLPRLAHALEVLTLSCEELFGETCVAESKKENDTSSNPDGSGSAANASSKTAAVDDDGNDSDTTSTARTRKSSDIGSGTSTASVVAVSTSDADVSDKATKAAEKDDDGSKSDVGPPAVPGNCVRVSPLSFGSRDGGHTVGNIDASIFQLRSKKYMSSRSSRVKVASRERMYDFVSMHFFGSNNASFERVVANGRLSLPSPPPVTQSRCAKLGVKYNLVVYLRGPRSGIGAFSSVPSKVVHAVMVYRIRSSFLDALEDESKCTEAHRLTQKWFRMSHCDVKTKNRLKLICVASNFEVLGLSSMFSGYNGKPCMITRSSTVTSGSNYLEVDINLLVFKKLPQVMFQKSLPKAPVLDLNIGFTIQGEHERELPEQIMCCFYARNVPLDGKEFVFVSDGKDVRLT